MDSFAIIYAKRHDVRGPHFFFNFCIIHTWHYTFLHVYNKFRMTKITCSSDVETRGKNIMHINVLPVSATIYFKWFRSSPIRHNVYSIQSCSDSLLRSSIRLRFDRCYFSNLSVYSKAYIAILPLRQEFDINCYIYNRWISVTRCRITNQRYICVTARRPDESVMCNERSSKIWKSYSAGNEFNEISVWRYKQMKILPH